MQFFFNSIVFISDYMYLLLLFAFLVYFKNIGNMKKWLSKIKSTQCYSKEYFLFFYKLRKKSILVDKTLFSI